MKNLDEENVKPRWREWLLDFFSNESSEEPGFKDMLREATARELIEPDALNIIYGALQVAHMQARDIMVPRSQMAYVKADARLEEFLPYLIEARHSRFPVVGETLDDIKGILHAKDILPWLLKEDWEAFNIKDVIRPPAVVPESRRLNDLLNEFRSRKNHMAVVVDEYGHVAGVVTIEDVLEQIVGDIEDEHDVDDDIFIKPLEDRCYTVKGITPIDEFNSFFETNFDEEEFDTISGLVTKEFGHLPEREESTTIQDYVFKVLNSDSRRINLLHLSAPSKQ
ncbi:MAG: magnesium/cobalt efflux protein [Gammaproteobacteria bacterium]|nr:magnesium/cobalt efflux protein [Gammaproteobacteria bacterium]